MYKCIYKKTPIIHTFIYFCSIYSFCILDGILSKSLKGVKFILGIINLCKKMFIFQNILAIEIEIGNNRRSLNLFFLMLSSLHGF